MISAVIVCWNNQEQVVQTIASLRAAAKLLAEIILVGNGRRGALPAELCSIGVPVRKVQLDQNIGFAGAVNVALRLVNHLESDYVLLLNTDIEFDDNLIQDLLAHALASSKPAIVAPMLYSDMTRTKFSSGFGGALDGCTIRIFGSHEMDAGQYNNSAVDFVFGTCMLVDLRIMSELGGMDERFFMYFEDVDLCLRAKQRGYAIVLAKSIGVGHHGSSSLAGAHSRREAYLAHSRLLLVRKHFGTKCMLFSVVQCTRWLATLLRKGATRDWPRILQDYLSAMLLGVIGIKGYEFR